MKYGYEIWQRYGRVHKVYDTILDLSDEEARAVQDCFSDCLELRRVDGTDISYLYS